MPTDRTIVDVVSRAATDLDDAPPPRILKWALDQFHPRLAVTASMADAVLVDMAARLRADVPVIFLDTGYHFGETLAMRDAVAERYRVRLLSVHPRRTVAEQHADHGRDLYRSDPDLCCRLRKVEPLGEVLADFDGWVSGIRRDEGGARADTRVVEWDERRGKVKVNPLAGWTQALVDRYIADHRLPVNPLVAAGFASIGCAPCTSKVTAGAPPRSGRWSGTQKVECGLHI